MALFDIGNLSFRPFITDRAEFDTAGAGSGAVAASVLPYAPREAVPGEMVGTAYAVVFLAEEWPGRTLPAKGSICYVGAKRERLFVAQVFRVGDLIHVIAAQNVGAYN